MIDPHAAHLRPRDWVALTAVISNAVVVEGTMCVGICGGVVALLWAPAAPAMVVLVLVGCAGLATGIIKLFRGAAGRPELVLPGLVWCLAGAGFWLVVAGWGLAWAISERGWQVPLGAWLGLAPPLLLIAMNGFLLAILRARPVTPDPDLASPQPV